MERRLGIGDRPMPVLRAACSAAGTLTDYSDCSPQLASSSIHTSTCANTTRSVQTTTNTSYEPYHERQGGGRVGDQVSLCRRTHSSSAQLNLTVRREWHFRESSAHSTSITWLRLCQISTSTNGMRRSTRLRLSSGTPCCVSGGTGHSSRYHCFA